MKTLRQDVSKMREERRLRELTEIREVIKDTRENVWEIIQKKQDQGQPFDKEMNQIEQLNSNLYLVVNTINSIK